MTVLDAIIVSTILLIFAIIIVILLYIGHVKDIKHEIKQKDKFEKLLNEINKNEERINDFKKQVNNFDK